MNQTETHVGKRAPRLCPAWWSDVQQALRSLPSIRLTRRMLADETAYDEWREQADLALRAVVNVIRRHVHAEVMWTTEPSAVFCRDMSADLDDQPYMELTVDVDEMDEMTLIMAHTHSPAGDRTFALTPRDLNDALRELQLPEKKGRLS